MVRDRARYARPNHIFFRHVGRETKDVYFRVNPQAIRVQQSAKGSVVDTLGGYFREVFYSEDPQRHGLMLPDLTIECDTGAGYRQELKKLEWIWRNHGVAKADGTPADTYFMDMADEDTLWFDGGGHSSPWSEGGPGGGLPQGTDPLPPINPAVSQINAQRIVNAKRQFKTVIAKTMNNTRFVPRCFKVEILGFAYDESVQDPYRIRFNFRCKILRDEFWEIDQPLPEETNVVSMEDWVNGNTGKLPDSKGALIQEALKKSTDFPLNPAAQVAIIKATLGLLPANAGAIVDPIINQVIAATGIGQTEMLGNAIDNGWSAYDPELGQRLYWRSEFSGVQVTQDITQALQSVYPALPASVQAVTSQLGVQVGPWSPAAVTGLSSVVQALSLLGVKI